MARKKKTIPVPARPLEIFQVTQEKIDNGKVQHPSQCSVSQTMTDRGYHVTVTQDYIQASKKPFSKENKGIFLTTDQGLKYWIHHYDQDLPVNPMNFGIDWEFQTASLLEAPELVAA